jgi:NAD(P)H-hydrate repair Nnr-like enzyme with NAD(P)H-hydrate epimerase domain
MTVERGPDGWLRADFSRDVHLDVTLRELANGLLHSPPGHADAQAWAFVVYALISPIESDEHPSFDLVIDALWEMSFGEAMRPELREALERIVASSGGEATTK